MVVAPGALRLARLRDVRVGFADFRRRPLLRRGVGGSRALQLGAGACPAGLIAIEQRQADVDARPHLESFAARRRLHPAPR